MTTSSKRIYPSSFLAVAAGGLITGVLQVVLSISYAALIYRGVLSPYVGQGIGFALFGALIIATVIALFSASPGTIGSNQDVSVAIFSIISVAIVSEMPPGAPVEDIFYTVVIAIAVTVLLTGLFFLGLGLFKLGGLVRYFPYPVVGGFLAGTGWLLLTGGYSLATGNMTFNESIQPLFLVRWLPSLLFALILLFTIRRFKKYWILPGFVLGGMALFYGAVWCLGSSPGELSAQGWLLGPFPNQPLWHPFSFSKLAMADWTVIFGQAGNIITVLTVSSIALLLNASAFELETKQDVDLNKELCLAGFGNLLSSLSPGFVGFRQLCLTVLNFRMRAQSRVVGLTGVGIIALTLFFGAPVVSYFPKAIMGGVLMYLGLSFLVEWAYDTWFTLPAIDCIIIWLVLLVIATVGFMPGIAVGLVAAVVMFVVSYSRLEVVRHELTGKNFQSPVLRRTDQRLILESKGESLYILQLQGFIFFGTANRLFDKIKNRLYDRSSEQFNFLVLDLQRVGILDSTGMLSFRKLKNLTNDYRTHLVITAPSKVIQRQMIQGGLPSSHELTHYFPDLNTGIEWCEEQILQEAGKQFQNPLSLAQQLSTTLLDEGNVHLILQCLERMDCAPGTEILAEGEPPDDLYFIESGQVTTRGKESEVSYLHLETMKHCRVVGDIGFYLGRPRTADVVTAEQCTMYRLSSTKLRELEKENPEVASKLHQLIVRLLAERVTHLVKTVSALQK